MWIPERYQALGNIDTTTLEESIDNLPMEIWDADDRIKISAARASRVLKQSQLSSWFFFTIKND